MNYKRIYEEFIADRRTKEVPESEYGEVHHILPRCMGGGNEPENLIRLTPEDHYFAHLLLAHIHNNRDMWGAVLMMAKARENRGLKGLTRFRHSYGMARRRWHAVNTGWGATNVDRNGYFFFHLDGDYFVGSRFEFAEYSGVPRANVSYIVRNKGAVTSGWSLVRRTREEYEAELSARCSRNAHSKKNPVRDKVLRVYENIHTGETITAYQAEMVSSGRLTSSNSSNLARLKLGTVRQGWRVVKVIPPDAANDNAVNSERAA